MSEISDKKAIETKQVAVSVELLPEYQDAEPIDISFRNDTARNLNDQDQSNPPS